MDSRFISRLFAVFATLSLTFLVGCAGFEYAPKKEYLFYHKELPQAERAVEDAALSGKDKQCPEEFNEAKTLMEKAYETYWACRTKEARDMARDALIKAKHLCPPPPVCELSASPKEIEIEQSSVLTMKTSGKAKSAMLDGTPVAPSGGTKTVTPRNSMPYLAQVTGPGGSSMCSATVTVNIPPAPGCDLSAAPAQIEKGQSSNLTLKTSGRIKAAILDNTSVSPSGGTKTVTPSDSTTYIAQCSGPGGLSVGSATVVVVPPPVPGCELSASPAEIEQGQSATLTLKTSGQVTSAIVDGAEVSTAGGTKNVTPKNTTPYLAKCSGPGGSSIAATTVTVVPPPAPGCEISASPAEIELGQYATLTLKTSGQVTSTVIDGAEAPAAGITKSVTPKNTTPYLAKCSGPGGLSIATTTITVIPPAPPAGELTAIPQEIEKGQSSTLTFKTSGKVTSANIDGTAVAPEGGTKTVTPATSSSYLAQASGPGGTAVSTASVSVILPPAPSCELTASPKDIEQGGSSTLTLKTSGKVASVILDGAEADPAGCSRAVSPKSTTPYIARITGPGGSAMCTAVVSVTPPPPPVPKVIDRFSTHVNFDFNKYEIRKADMTELQKVINFVKQKPGAKIYIDGHTDSIGTNPYNQALSDKRAEAVRQYLIKEGVKDSIITVGFGKAKPVAPNSTDEGRAGNRRAEILIMAE